MGEPRSLRRIVGSALLLLFGVAELVVGIWALASPRAFYDRFPGFGWHWVSAAGPYDEHLVRDFGGALAGLAVVALVCAVRPGRGLLLATAAGWELEAVPHFAYHVLHQDALPSSQDAANLSVLALAMVAPLVAGVLLWPTSRRRVAPASGGGPLP
jgi:hypothetical protein